MAVLVIGAGIAGIEAALNLANYGLKVYLVDDTPSMGGMMARLDKTFPTNDCSICIEAPKMYEVQKHPNIEFMSNTEVRRVQGSKGQFKVRLHEKARFIDAAKCKGCGKCVEACPLSVPDEIDGRIGGKRKLIYIPFPQAVPNVYVIDDRCRYGKMKESGACIGACIVDCIQCRQCPIARCVKACKEEGADAVMLWQQNRNLEVTVASIVVATGIESYEPPVGLYGYGIHKNVLTNTQFERLMNAGGPTSGEIVRPSDGAHPHRIAWIQCVGREKRAGELFRTAAGLQPDDRCEVPLPYCSKVCCMIATKQTIITKEHAPQTETYILYNNLKAYGKGFYRFYEKAKELGVRYIKGRPSDVREVPGTRNLVVRYENTERAVVEELEVELLVLSTGLVPSRRNVRLAGVLKIELNEYGFFKECDPVTSPLKTGVEGIYLCGGATGPIDISESVIQAIAASSRAAVDAMSTAQVS